MKESTKTLSDDLLKIFRDMQDMDISSEDETQTEKERTEALKTLSDRLAAAIAGYVAKGRIVYTSGLAAPNGSIAGVFNKSGLQFD